MQVALVSDTHIPSRATAIPDAFERRIEGADHTIHAGDFDSEGALANQRDLASELTAVAGNMDPRIALPAVATVELGGVEFVVTHGTGSPAAWERRVADIVREERTAEHAIGIAGHTHEMTDIHYDGIRLLNPGSATGAAPASRTTMMTATVEAGNIDLDIHEV